MITNENMKKKKSSPSNIIYTRKTTSSKSFNKNIHNKSIEQKTDNKLSIHTKMNSMSVKSKNSILCTGIFIVYVFLISPVSSISILRNRSVSSKLEPLLWSSSNEKFAPTQTRRYLELTGKIGDSIDLVCPKHNPAHNKPEYLTIYKVSSKYEFDNCIINPNNPQTVPILKCDEPSTALKFTIFFIKFSPVPFALEFEEGKEYYFLTTSSGDLKGLDYMTGGLCSKFNMKFSIKIEKTGAKMSAANNPSSLLQKMISTTSTSSEKLQQAESHNKGKETPLPSKMNLVSSSPQSFSYNIYFYISNSVFVLILSILFV